MFRGVEYFEDPVHHHHFKELLDFGSQAA